MDYFRNEDSSIDFMVRPQGWDGGGMGDGGGGPTDTDPLSPPLLQVACMQFINIVVHSGEDMNFRVHLQYEFTKLGLEDFLQVIGGGVPHSPIADPPPSPSRRVPSAEVEAHGEREAAGADPGLPG